MPANKPINENEHPCTLQNIPLSLRGSLRLRLDGGIYGSVPGGLWVDAEGMRKTRGRGSNHRCPRCCRCCWGGWNCCEEKTPGGGSRRRENSTKEALCEGQINSGQYYLLCPAQTYCLSSSHVFQPYSPPHYHVRQVVIKYSAIQGFSVQVIKRPTKKQKKTKVDRT